nr:hypothetical protein A5881_000596 [Enterococcus termitis]
MYNIGVASFSGALSNDYLDKINEIGQIKLIHEENIQQVNQEIDCVIIPDNSSDDNTMSLTLKNIIEIKAVTNKLVWVLTNEMNSIKTVSYTHLDVYKRQSLFVPGKTVKTKEAHTATVLWEIAEVL